MAPHGENRILELKNNKETYILKRGSFRSAQSEKWNKELCIFEKGVFWSSSGRKSRESLGAAKAEKWVAFTRHIPVLALYGSTCSQACTSIIANEKKPEKGKN